MLHQASKIRGYHLEARDATIGTIKDFLFDDEAWTIRYLVVDTGRWLPGRRVLLSPAAFLAGDRGSKKLPVDLTKNQIENSPGEETDRPVSAEHQRDLHAYYGWPAYWSTGPYPMAGVVPPPSVAIPPAGTSRAADAGRQAGDPHLRSVDHVTGYEIQATDGAIGHVEDFLLNLTDWTVRGIVIDTRNWLPGRKVVVAASVIDRVSWTDSAVAVHLTREAIEASPEYSPDLELPRDYEQQLAEYYEMMTPGR